jgi:UDP:flavonoid glycosyltransferase YjiC (YdhE family)
MWADFDAFCRERGAPGLTWGAMGPDLIHESPWLNLYLYPEIADYVRERPLAPTWHRLDTCVRATDGEWQLPEHLRAGDGALIYLSLGSLGSADVGLLQRLVDILGSTRHRVIVSKGPLAEQIRLHDNMVGEAILPQPAILPQVDVVVTHGGNNTVTECFNFGKPMVVLPLFWDQVDNAQRLDETGFGVRLATYDFEDEQLTGAVDRLLADGELLTRMARAAAGYQARSGTVVAASRIEEVARTGLPVLR